MRNQEVPAENIGYLDSKVLGQEHMVVWEESGKVSTVLKIDHALYTHSSRTSSSKTLKALYQ
jgi:hypothetical protein